MSFNFISMIRGHRALAFMVLLYVLFGILRLNDLSLYTDSTRYVIWGTSLAHAKGFEDDTQPDPERYVVNAPFYSVVLSPVLLLFPNSLIAAKVWTLLLGACFIVAFYALLLKFFDTPIALMGIAPIVFNPLLLLLSTEALSETSFLAAMALCFILLERLETNGPSSRSDLVMLLVITSLLVLLREVAVALVGSIFLYLVVRRQYRRAILVIIGFALLYGAWLYRNLVLVGAPASSQASNVNFIFEHFLTPPQASLRQEFWLRFTTNASGYATHLAGLIFYPLPSVLIVEPSQLSIAYYKAMVVIRYIVPAVYLPIFFLGLYRDVRDHRTGIARLFYVFSYLLIIVLYPVHDVRFLVPLLPVQIYWCLCGIQWIRSRWLARRAQLARGFSFALMACLVVPNLLCMFEVEKTNLRYMSNSLAFYDHLQEAGLGKNMFTRPWRILADTINARIPEGSTIAGALKEPSIFIGNRKLLELNNAVPVTTFERYLRTYAADYVLSTGSWDSFPSYQMQMGESRRFWFEPVTAVAGMKLYKVCSTLLTPRDIWLPTKRIEVDTTTANGLLRLGRLELTRGRYAQAIWLLQQAQALAPVQAMIPYQLLVAYAMSGQLEDASRELQVLYGYEQATAYIGIATKQLDVAYSERQTESSNAAMQRSMNMVNTARFKWDLGYYGAAYSALRSLLAADSTYFIGLLWGWDFAMQRGDTTQARVYLRQLKAIDRSNVIVQQFAAVDLLADSLRQTTAPQRRSAFHLAIARAYKTVDLPDEAVDDAQRALLDDPKNPDAWLFQAQLFEEKKMPAAAHAAYLRVLELDPSNAVAREKGSMK
jgi:tetratricopeptide (TPR) repeat protein